MNVTTSQRIAVSSTTVSSIAASSVALIRVLLGIGVLWGLERLCHALLRAIRVEFPSSVAGMVLCCCVLSAIRWGSPSLAVAVTTGLEPARQFLARWMPVFFAPPVVLLPLTSLPKAYDVVTGLVVLCGGFAANLLVTARVASIGGVADDTTAEAVGIGAVWSRRAVVFGWSALALLAGLGVFGWLGFESTWFRPILGVSVGVVGFSLGEVFRQRLARWGMTRVATVCHPVLSCVVLTCAVWMVVGLPLQTYLTHGRGLSDPTQPGNVLVAMLTPAVVSFGLGLDAQRVLLRRNLWRLLGATAILSLFSMVSTVLAARLLGLSDLYGRALISRAVTTPVALVMARDLNADPGLSAVFVVFSGLLGALFGLTLLRRGGFSNTLVVGVAMGAASHGIGTAALVEDQPRAVPFSATSFALTAFFHAIFASVPLFRQGVLWLLG